MEWFSTRDTFASPRTFYYCLQTFLVVTTQVCSWHLVGKGQGCCWKNYLAPNISSTKNETPWPRLYHIYSIEESIFVSLSLTPECVYKKNTWLYHCSFRFAVMITWSQWNINICGLDQTWCWAAMWGICFLSESL